MVSGGSWLNLEKAFLKLVPLNRVSDNKKSKILEGNLAPSTSTAVGLFARFFLGYDVETHRVSLLLKAMDFLLKTKQRIKWHPLP